MLSVSHTNFHHLYAEVASAPISSESAFYHAVTRLKHRSERENERRFWVEVENRLTAQFSEKMLDEILSVRSSIWNPRKGAEDPEPLSITGYIRSLAAIHLESHGYFSMPMIGTSTPDEGSDSRSELAGHNRRRFGRDGWFWLSRSMPCDLLVCAQDAGCELHHVMPALDHLLRENEFAQIHVHLGAAMSFPRLWTCALNVLTYSGFRFDAFANPTSILEGGKHIAIWLLQAMIVRQILAHYIFSSRQADDLEHFFGYVPKGRQQEEPSRDASQDSRSRQNHSKNPNNESDDDIAERSQVFSLFNSTFVDHGLLNEVIGSIACPRESGFQFDQTSFCAIQSLYRQLINVPGADPRDIDELLETDPIGFLADEVATRQHDYEDIWIRESLGYLAAREDEGNPDELYELLFWQVQRVRSLFFRHITQQKQTPGLIWFTKYYRRISAARKGVLSHGALLWSAAETAGLNNGLRSLEVRTSPPDTAQELLDEISEIADAALRIQGKKEDDKASPSFSDPMAAPQSAPEALKPEIGVVLHFVKERERESPESISPYGETSHENPEWGNYFYRYAHYYKKTIAKADAIASVLDNFPLSLQWIRGVDVCNDELSMPTWIFVPMFRRVFEASKRASMYLRATLDLKVPAIRKTAHVGEDFVHLLTGLRRIDEALEFLSIREGDRLGHALALGADPNQWATESGPITMDKITRLFDLSWEWSVLDSVYSETAPGDRIHFVKARIRALIDDLFSHWEDEGLYAVEQIDGPEWSGFESADDLIEDASGRRYRRIPDFRLGRVPEIHEIANLRKDAADPEKLKAVGFPDEKPSEVFHRLQTRRDKILLGYLTDYKLFRLGRNDQMIDPIDTGPTLKALQDGLRQKVGSRGVVVEVNPTSNLLISRFSEMKKHPLWRLDSPDHKDKVPPVSLAVGSDDPLVFATDLRQEYQRLVDAILSAGYSERQARRWINEVRNNGLESRFTLSRILPRNVRIFPNETAQRPAS